MCGRYFVDLNYNEITMKIKERLEMLSIFDYAQNEIYPTQNAIVLIKKNNQIDADVMRWGIEGKSLLINARHETLNERITYKKIKENRCVVVANGFFEWKNKKKIYITHASEPVIYLAAIYNEKHEFVILTGNSENQMKKIHDRTPIIMNQNEMKEYLAMKLQPKVKNDYLHFELCE